MNKLMEYFAAKKKRVPQSAPLHKIIAFAMFSTRRQEEISRILWSDLDTKNKRILVQDMKDPNAKKGNHIYVELPDPCMKIIESMPKYNERIFPYGTDAISAAFTRACKFLDIEDLHFQNLRHEGQAVFLRWGRQSRKSLLLLVIGHGNLYNATPTSSHLEITGTTGSGLRK